LINFLWFETKGFERRRRRKRKDFDQKEKLQERWIDREDL